MITINFNEEDNIITDKMKIEELANLISAYGIYIMEANEEDIYSEGFYPVDILEFIDNEYQEIQLYKNIDVQELIATNLKK